MILIFIPDHFIKRPDYFIKRLDHFIKWPDHFIKDLDLSIKRPDHFIKDLEFSFGKLFHQVQFPGFQQGSVDRGGDQLVLQHQFFGGQPVNVVNKAIGLAGIGNGFHV